MRFVIHCLVSLVLISGFIPQMDGLTAVPEASALTIGEEKELGREFYKYARAHYKILNDPDINHYLSTLGDRLSKQFPEVLFDYKFFIIDDNRYNAFAAPSGYIFINSGLIRAMASESELAGILTHEIAHVYCRHISEKIEKNKKISLATLAGIAASAFLGGATGIPGSAIAIGSAAAGQAASLAYSRKDERQADQLGLKYLCQAGYTPEGMLTVLKKIKSKHWFDTNEVPTYLSTHPAVNERIAYISALVESNSFTDCAQHRPRSSGDDFDLIQTRITARYSDETRATRKFEARLEKSPQDPLAHYGYGLLLARKSRHPQAIEHFQAALAQDAFNPYFLKALGQAYFSVGKYQKALEILQSIPKDHFYDPVQEFYLARTLEKLGQGEKATAILQDLIRKRPETTTAYYYLGNIYGRQGKMTAAHLNLGIFYKKKRQIDNALFHLKKARSLNPDDTEKEEIRKLLDEIHQEHKKKTLLPWRED